MGKAGTVLNKQQIFCQRWAGAYVRLNMFECQASLERLSQSRGAEWKESGRENWLWADYTVHYESRVGEKGRSGKHQRGHCILINLNKPFKKALQRIKVSEAQNSGFLKKHLAKTTSNIFHIRSSFIRVKMIAPTCVQGGVRAHVRTAFGNWITLFAKKEKFFALQPECILYIFFLSSFHKYPL